MRKTICVCVVFYILCMTYTCANAQQKQKSTVVTYYPAPKADYATVQLSPSGTSPAGASPGQIFYNSTEDRIQYFTNITKKWENFGGGSSNTSSQYLPLLDVFPGTAVVGDVYYNNVTDSITYINKTGRWINLAADPIWSESALINATASDPYPHHNIYLANDTLRRVGHGTSSPEAAFHIWQNDSGVPKESEDIAGFDKSYMTPGDGVTVNIMGYTEGTKWCVDHGGGVEGDKYHENSSWFYACRIPSTQLKFAAVSPAGSISFNVGGYNNSNSEIMRLVNPGGESNPTPRVGIGNSTPPFALFVDSDQNDTTVFASRGVHDPDSWPDYWPSGYWSLVPDLDTLFIGYGVYKQSYDWYVDKYYNGTGTNKDGQRIGIDFDMGGLEWGVIHEGNYDASGMVTSWFNVRYLFNKQGVPQACSSRKLKEDIIPLDPEEILQKIDKLEVSRWNYKTEGPGVTHIGPVSEDFSRLFKTGESEKSLAPIDSCGVSLAGVKALAGRVNLQNQQLQELQAAVQEIKSQLGRGQ